MVNFIIIAIIVVLLALGCRETIRHFRGQGACCGGAVAKAKKKKLKNPIVCTYTFHVDGMECQNCVNKVIGAINDISGASATVSLKKKTAKVCCDREIDREVIRQAIIKKGYDAE